MRKSLDQLSMKGKWKHEIQNQYKMCKEFDFRIWNTDFDPNF